jgi:hypothetical protein
VAADALPIAPGSSIFPLYTERDSKIGFGLERKLPRIDDRRLRKLVRIIITNQLAIVNYRGFGQAENPIFESRSVYTPSSSIVPIRIKLKAP